jgi:hypothetical protein
MRAALPEATITPKVHEGTLDCEDVPWGVVTRYGALAVVQRLFPARRPRRAAPSRTRRRVKRERARQSRRARRPPVHGQGGFAGAARGLRHPRRVSPARRKCGGGAH